MRAASQARVRMVMGQTPTLVLEDGGGNVMSTDSDTHCRVAAPLGGVLQGATL